MILRRQRTMPFRDAAHADAPRARHRAAEACRCCARRMFISITPSMRFISILRRGAHARITLIDDAALSPAADDAICASMPRHIFCLAFSIRCAFAENTLFSREIAFGYAALS